MSFFKIGNSEIEKGDVRSPKKIIYHKDVNKNNGTIKNWKSSSSDAFKYGIKKETDVKHFRGYETNNKPRPLVIKVP